MVRARVQFLTGGTARERDASRRSGVIPEPTVIVRMGEGARFAACGAVCPYGRAVSRPLTAYFPAIDPRVDAVGFFVLSR